MEPPTSDTPPPAIPPELAQKIEALLTERKTLVGRTAYDFGSELIQVLGRLTPLFVLLAMSVYTVVEVSRSYQAAESAATARHAKSVESLNSLLTTSYSELDKIRKSQLENLEKISNLGGLITDALTKNQTMIAKSRDETFAAEQQRQKSEFALDTARREQQQLQEKNDKLQSETWRAESTIDVAERLVAFLSDNRNLEKDIRYLSRRYESVNVGGMTRDPRGNTYFGLYRIPGSDIGRFIDFLPRAYPQFAVRLTEAGGQPAAIKGDPRFQTDWQSLARDPEFAAAQDQFIAEVYYARFLTQLRRFFTKSDGKVSFDPGTHSEALQAVLWSVAVQHGANTPLIPRAFDGIDLSTAADAALIKAIYAERRKTAVYFSAESELTQKLLAARYRFEEAEALKMFNSPEAQK